MDDAALGYCLQHLGASQTQTTNALPLRTAGIGALGFIGGGQDLAGLKTMLGALNGQRLAPAINAAVKRLESQYPGNK